MVLITGGTGFIGARVVRRLLTAGHDVVCFDAAPQPARLGALARDPRLHLVTGDITDLGDVVEAIRTYRVERIIHTAALLTGASQAAPQRAIRVNVHGTANVLEAARHGGVRRVVYASSMVVHGHQWDHGDVDLDEDARLVPHTLYAHTKVMNEATAQAYADAYGLDCRGLRIAAPFAGDGPASRLGAEVTRLVTLAAAGQPVELRLAPGERPPSTYVEDIAEILVRLAERRTLTRPVYVCSVAAEPIEAVAALVRAVIPTARISFGETRGRVTLPYRIDARRLEADLGYRLPPLAQRLGDAIAEARRARTPVPSD